MEIKGKTINFGDTSFREGNYIQPCKIILKLFRKYIDTPTRWNHNTNLQNFIYDLFVIDMSNILHKDINRKKAYKLANKKGMRGRGIANAMTKIGLTNTNKQVSPVACDWLDNKITKPDKLERDLPIMTDNLVFLRQLFKLRIYSKNNHNVFIRPLIFMLVFFNKYPTTPLKQVGEIMDSLKPDKILTNPNYIKNIIDDYQNVINGESFEFYFAQHFQNEYITNDKINMVKDLLSKLPVNSYNDLSLKSKNEFQSAFTNRKSNTSKATHEEIYFNFINLLVKFRLAYKNRNNYMNLNNIIKRLIFEGKNSKIKKAFGFNKTIFTIRRHDNLVTFLHKYTNSIYLRGNRINIYYAFLESKNNDIRREYADMVARIFSLSAIVNKNSNRVKSNLLPIWKEVLDVSNIHIIGYGSRKNYDLNSKSKLYQDISLQEILQLNNHQISNIKQHINIKYGLPKNASSNQLIDKLRNIEKIYFDKMITRKFPINLVIKLLKEIMNRCNTKATNKREQIDNKIQRHFSPETTVPTIFEYLLGISWYYLSNKKINLLNSFHLEMDGNFLPVNQAPGGEGDIEIHYPHNFILMLEATLMDRQAQKRGELEPVIRHSVNLKSEMQKEHVNSKCQTIYVADKLDKNVDNIFRDTYHVELNNSAKTKNTHPVHGVNIFPLSINELIILLEMNKKDPKYNDIFVIKTINNNLDKPYLSVLNNWRKISKRKLFNNRSY